MQEITVKTWEECQSEFKGLTQARSALRPEESRPYISNMLYRGQGNAAWRLTTTLERYAGTNAFLSYYYTIISIAKPQIETFMEKVWEIPSVDDFEKWLASRKPFLPPDLPAYEYMIYLRHHGFPSPLLDWTRSPFIAAYFAFHNVAHGIQNVSIYAYMEYAAGLKISSGQDLCISSLGPNVRTHARHFLQQCEYTICTVNNGGRHSFACHEDVFLKMKKDKTCYGRSIFPARRGLKFSPTLIP